MYYKIYISQFNYLTTELFVLF